MTLRHERRNVVRSCDSLKTHPTLEVLDLGFEPSGPLVTSSDQVPDTGTRYAESEHVDTHDSFDRALQRT
jgi:hypothetical protein